MQLRSKRGLNRSRKYYQYGTEGQKLHENSAPVLVIISGNSLVLSRKIITSTGFYRYCAADASAPVVVINQSPHLSPKFLEKIGQKSFLEKRVLTAAGRHQKFARKALFFRKRDEYGFGEYGFKPTASRRASSRLVRRES